MIADNRPAATRTTGWPARDIWRHPPRLESELNSHPTQGLRFYDGRPATLSTSAGRPTTARSPATGGPAAKCFTDVGCTAGAVAAGDAGSVERAGGARGAVAGIDAVAPARTIAPAQHAGGRRARRGHSRSARGRLCASARFVARLGSCAALGSAWGGRRGGFRTRGGVATTL